MGRSCGRPEVDDPSSWAYEDPPQAGKRAAGGAFSSGSETAGTILFSGRRAAKKADPGENITIHGGFAARRYRSRVVPSAPAPALWRDSVRSTQTHIASGTSAGVGGSTVVSAGDGETSWSAGFLAGAKTPALPKAISYRNSRPREHWWERGRFRFLFLGANLLRAHVGEAWPSTIPNGFVDYVSDPRLRRFCFFFPA